MINCCSFVFPGERPADCLDPVFWCRRSYFDMIPQQTYAVHVQISPRSTLTPRLVSVFQEQKKCSRSSPRRTFASIL